MWSVSIAFLSKAISHEYEAIRNDPDMIQLMSFDSPEFFSPQMKLRGVTRFESCQESRVLDVGLKDIPNHARSI